MSLLNTSFPRQAGIAISLASLALVSLLASQSTFAQASAGSSASSTTCPAPPVPVTAEEMPKLAAQARDRGFLWRISKNDRVGYLYGSIHIGKREWSLPGPKTLAALQASDTIALELDILDPAVQQQMSDPSKLGLRPLTLPADANARIATLATKFCAPAAAIATMHPALQMATLSLFDARFSGLEFVFGSEMFLAQFGRGTQKSVRGLETPQIQMRALTGGDPKDLVDAINSSLKLMEAGGQRKQTQRLVNTWANGDLQDLQRYEEWCDCANTPAEKRFFQRVNDDRNPGLAEAIDKLVREGRKVFAAVGALHMVGGKPVQKLLADMGYKVERIDFAPANADQVPAPVATPKAATK